MIKCYGIVLPEISLNYNMATHPLGWGLIPRSWSRFASDPQPLRQINDDLSNDLLDVPDLKQSR